ncbi:MAG: septal ring lytic transglycosylase RlpA family protein [Nitrospirae bacterium]|nr:septal ring lytic transglycosylase RlpA family protein [Candidatus Manganitrophaceae bacterium]
MNRKKGYLGLQILRPRLVLLAVFLIFLSACTVPLKKHSFHLGYSETGLASWYGKDFHGRPTASGEIYDMFEVTAAHKSLPLGTLLHVRDLDTGKSIKVKVNDRGPFVRKRILDLSYGAAKALGIVGTGIAKIELKIIGRVPIFLPGTKEEKVFFVQLGSYQVKENALRVKNKVARDFEAVSVKAFKTGHGHFYRVRIGPYTTEEAARSTLRKLRSSRSLISADITPIVIPNH